MPALHVESRPIASLTPNPRNPRTHSRKQIRQIADSIRTFGFTNPVLIDDRGAIIAGHGRVEAAKVLELESVPTIRLSAMTEAQKRAYVIADNKLALNAGWDEQLLALELQYLSALELDFEIEVIGFETAEIDLLITGLGESAEPADQVPELDAQGPAVSRLGDLWQIGGHRLLCADATDPDSFARLMAGARAQMVFSDPPYNVPIDGHVCGLGRVRHREFAMAAGEMDPAEFTAFLETVFGHLVAHSGDGAIHFICMDWRHIGELLRAAEPRYSALKNVCVWNKTNAGMGSLYRSKHELVFVFKSGTQPHINNVELGRHGRYRSNVWDYAGVNTLKADRREELALHPTVKPVALVADAIQDCSRRSGIVLDCFLGSGTTLIAAENTGRRGYGIELDPRYVDVALERLADLGLDAIHADTGMSFAEVKAQRHAGETSDGE
jgi:DNA modification methylase